MITSINFFLVRIWSICHFLFPFFNDLLFSLFSLNLVLLIPLNPFSIVDLISLNFKIVFLLIIVFSLIFLFFVEVLNTLRDLINFIIKFFNFILEISSLTSYFFLLFSGIFNFSWKYLNLFSVYILFSF